MEDPALEVTRTVYESLRNEILEKMKFSNQLAAYKLLSVGALLGFIATKTDSISSFFLISAIVLGVGLAIAFDLSLYQNNRAIISVGIYMREYLEPELRLSAGKSTLVMWEEFIVERSQREKVYNFFEASNYLMTVLMMLLGIAYLWTVKKWAVSIVAAMLVIECAIIYKGMHKGRRKQSSTASSGSTDSAT